MSSEDPLSFNQLVHAIAEFIEVAIHTILYVRQVYPADIFVRRKKYNTAVYQSRHPALNEYITGAIKAVQEELAQGKIEKVVIVIKDKEQTAMERFIFSLDTIINVEGFNKDTSVEEGITFSSLAQYFRSFILKLSLIEAQIGQMYLGDDVSFAIVIELKDGEVPRMSINDKEPPSWIPAVAQHTTAGVKQEAELHMIRAVNTGVINVSLAVQESAEKVIKEKAERQAKRKAENEARKEKAAADKRAEESNKGQEKPPEVDVEAKPAEVKDT
ncbi:DNA-binding protein [Panaeolus papilionaceus]|nr:DNA-binding protein [Panaeolus papilionaceus]